MANSVFEKCLTHLKKYIALVHFGISLINKNFDIADDEVMAEFPDLEKHKLITKPVRIRLTDEFDADGQSLAFNRRLVTVRVGAPTGIIIYAYECIKKIKVLL